MYIRDVEASLARPIKELKGFAKIQLEPGQRGRLEIPIDGHCLEFYDPQRKGWIAEPGEFEVLIGSSATDIRLKESFYT